MVWEYQCPNCDFSSSGNEEGQVIEDAQQHMDDKHGNIATREKVEQHIIGPG